MTVVGTVQELLRYPVKSMQGQRVEHTSMSRDGVAADRRLAVRDLETGKVASAKQPSRWRALLDCRAGVPDEMAGGVEVTLPDGRTLIHGEDDLDAALTGLLDREVALVAAAPGELGAYDSDWPRIDGLTLEGAHEFPVALATEAVTFADLAAIHLMTSATLARLRSLRPEAMIEPRRFRPNLVIDTGAEDDFLEDAWVGQRLRLGPEVELAVTLRTPRCVMTTVAQPGLDHEPAVLRAAATNRHDVAGAGTFACAGVYAEVAVPGTVALDDQVRLLGG